MNPENDHSYFQCTVVMETDKAVQVNIKKTNLNHWVPRSLCEIKPQPQHGCSLMEVEEWFAKKEGLGDG